MSAAGQRLRELHLTDEQAEVSPLRRELHREVAYTPIKEKLRLSSDKQSLHDNASLTLHDSPSRCYEDRRGGRSALEWGAIRIA